MYSTKDCYRFTTIVVVTNQARDRWIDPREPQTAPFPLVDHADSGVVSTCLCMVVTTYHA